MVSITKHIYSLLTPVNFVGALFISMCFLLLITGCGNDDEPTGEPGLSDIKIDMLFIKVRNISYSDPDCDTTVNPICVSLDLRYPEYFLHEEGYEGELSNPLSETNNVATRINRDVLSITTSRFRYSEEAITFTSPKQYFDSLLAEFNRDFGYGNGIPAYSDEISIVTRHNNYGILSLEANFSIYRGGAHGIYGKEFRNYDLHDNSLLSFEDVFVTERKSRKKLSTIIKSMMADSARREMGQNSEYYSNVDLKGTDDEVLMAYGYFKPSEIEAADNFILLNHGVEFNYPPYEIAPYALGETVIFIPYETISVFMLDSTPARRMFIEVD